MEKADFPVHVLINPDEVRGSLNQATIFMAEQIVPIDRKQIILKAGFLDNKSEGMKRIESAILREFELGSYLSDNGASDERTGDSE